MPKSTCHDDVVLGHISARLNANPLVECLQDDVVKPLTHKVRSCVNDGRGGSIIVHAVSGMTVALDAVRLALPTDGRARVVHLNGLLLPTERECIVELARQLNAALNDDEDEEGMPRMSTGQAMRFVLEHLKTACSSSATIVVLEHFDVFVTAHSQTLLYNLLDMSYHQEGVPLLVVCLVQSHDTIEQMEKRVKSRLSQTALFASTSSATKTSELVATLFKRIFTVDMSDVEKKNRTLMTRWNKSVEAVFSTKACVDALFHIVGKDNQSTAISQLARAIACEYGGSSDEVLTVEHVRACTTMGGAVNQWDTLWATTDTMTAVQVCLLCAVREQCADHHTRTFNFEQIFRKYQRFVNANKVAISTHKPIVFKSFERLVSDEIVVAVSEAERDQQPYFIDYSLERSVNDINEALGSCQTGALPAAIQHWIGYKLVV